MKISDEDKSIKVFVRKKNTLHTEKQGITVDFPSEVMQVIRH